MSSIERHARLARGSIQRAIAGSGVISRRAGRDPESRFGLSGQAEHEVELTPSLARTLARRRPAVAESRLAQPDSPTSAEVVQAASQPASGATIPIVESRPLDMRPAGDPSRSSIENASGGALRSRGFSETPHHGLEAHATWHGLPARDVLGFSETPPVSASSLEAHRPSSTFDHGRIELETALKQFGRFIEPRITGEHQRSLLQRESTFVPTQFKTTRFDSRVFAHSQDNANDWARFAPSSEVPSSQLRDGDEFVRRGSSFEIVGDRRPMHELGLGATSMAAVSRSTWREPQAPAAAASLDLNIREQFEIELKQSRDDGRLEEISGVIVQALDRRDALIAARIEAELDRRDLIRGAVFRG